MNATQTVFEAQRLNPRGRPPRHPSGRNLELYHELVCENRTQTEVAARFRVSQPRVAQIRRQIARWVSRFLPADIKAKALMDKPSSSLKGDAGTRFHLAIALCRLHLQVAYEKYLGFFGGPSGATGYGHLLAASDAGLLPKDLAAKLPRRDLVESAVRMVRELDGLARVARRGPYFHLPDDLRPIHRQAI